MTTKDMLTTFRAAADRYAVASGGGTHNVYRRASVAKALFTSRHLSECQDWIAARAMAAVKRALNS